MEEGNDIKANLIISMQTQDTIGFSSILKNSKVHFTLLIDPGGFNIFHDLANCLVQEKSLLSFLSLLLSHFQSRYLSESDQILKEMLNSQTIRDRQTPLHLAVQHNRRVFLIQQLVKEFVNLGADPRMKDINLHGPMHIAAAQGRVAMFVYFYSQGLSLDEVDIRNRTALHLAALEGYDNMALVIIAWTKSLEVRDIEGYTPLHMAAISQSYRIVRHLLIHGAKRRAKDKSGKTPLDIATSKQNMELVEILVRNMQQPIGCCQKLNPCKAPLRPIGNSSKHIVLYVVLFFTRYTAVLLFLLPRFNIEYFYGSVGMFVISSLLFLVVSCKDPGYVKATDNLVELYETYKPEYICCFCRVMKSKNTRHCQHCNRCVRVRST